MSTSATPDNSQPTATAGAPLGTDGPPRRARHRLRFAAAIGATALVIVGLGAIVNGRGDDESADTAKGAELVEAAQRSPLMLIDDAAWMVAYADENGDEREVTFTNAANAADLYWLSGSLSERLGVRLDEGTDHGTHAVANGTARIVQYDPGSDYTALWESGGHVLEFRTHASSLDEFRGLLDSLVVVDTDAWLAAMPASVVGAADQSAVISEMLSGIPVPSDFDPDTLAADAGIKDRYQLGVRVVGTVSCAWFAQWIDATARDDAVDAEAAVDAMATSAQWPILQEMNQSGAYGEALQMYVDAMKTGGQVMPPDGPTIADSYQDALGCPD